MSVTNAQILAAIASLKTEMEAKMSALSDQVAAIGTTLSTVETNVTQLGTDLTAEIARLDAKITSGSVTPADLTNLQAINTRLTTLATTLQGLDTQATGA